MKEGVVEVDNGRWSGLVGEWVASNAGTGVGINEGLVEVSLFVGGESRNDLAIGGDLVAAEHEAEKTVESDKISARASLASSLSTTFGRSKGLIRTSEFKDRRI